MNAGIPQEVRTGSGMRTVRRLVGCYLALSVATLVAIVLLRNHSSLVTPAVWVRCSIVTVTAVLMTSFAARAARGSARSFLRLRLASGIMLVAIAVILALPGDFPLWIKVEQGICGLLLLGVVVLVNGSRLRGEPRR
jgi:O-antigen/teichoic acid export membrane protein